MPLVIADRVRETTTTSGTGTIALSGPYSGFQAFSVIGNGNTTYYAIIDAQNGAWEVGIGAYTSSGNTLSRATVLASSNAGALVNFGTGTKDVILTQPARRSVLVQESGSGLITGVAAFTANGVPYADSTSTLATSANMTFNGTRLTVADLADSGLTATRVVYSTTGGVLVDSANFTFNGTDLTVSGAVNAGSVNATTLDLTNLEVTNIKAKDGTAGMQLADSTGVVSFTSNPVLTGGTANGVAYLNGSKVLTTGSALTFDGTTLTSQAGVTSVVGAAGKYTIAYTTASAASRSWRIANDLNVFGDFAIQQSTTQTGSTFRDVYTSLNDGTSYWSVGGSEQMRLTSTGLGIGTSSPGYKLDVRSSGYPAANVESTSGSGANGAYFQAKNGGAAASFFGTETTSGGYSYTGSIANSAYFGSLGANTLQLITNSVARATLDSSGNLGLGVTPSAWGSNAKALEIGSGGSTSLAFNFSETNLSTNVYRINTGASLYKANGIAMMYTQSSGGHAWATAPSGTAGDAISFTQAMTLTDAGDLQVGFTGSSITAGGIASVPNSATSYRAVGHITGSASGSAYDYFLYAGSIIGSITQSGTTAVLYNVTSDQRLKENIQDAAPASALIDALQVREYDWKSDGSHQRYGFIAQELVTVAPEAVHQPADPEEMMAVDYSKLVPMLVKEIQSLRARVAALESI